jgi:hypothetical protein
MGQGRVIGSRTTGLSRWRAALVQLVLAAFVLQSFVIQTHIHFTPAELAQLTGKSDSHHDHWPANDDPANCPICQELLHSGQFVTPAAQFLLPPTLAVSTIAVVDEALPFVFAPSHNWQGRAPPRI